jgi:NADH-quinone oxidoreductase subunit M
MILPWFIGIPFAAGLFAWLLGDRRAPLVRWLSLVSLAVTLALGLVLWSQAPAPFSFLSGGPWLAQLDLPWIPPLGIRFQLAADGLSLLLLLLTSVVAMVAVASSWTEIQERVAFFHFNLLWTVAGIMGVFVAVDLFLFYFFWELMLIPMYFLIAIWGHENRRYASIKFFLFTQLSGLLMLAAILGLVFVNHRSTGAFTFSYFELLGTSMSKGTSFWLMAGFFIAFAVKLPAVPVHTWLADAHTEAPTGGSVILAGLLLKTGAYGMIRFVVPLFPEAASRFAPVAMVLAVIAILYGALLAFAQTDAKRLVAYTSISHMGFVLLGIFAWNTLALQGAVVEVVCHAMSTGALFAVVGALQERMHTRDLSRMGGLWSTAPRLGGVALTFALASLGLPGFGNFVGEFLVLLGAYRVSIPAAVFAAAGLISAVIYALWLIQSAFHGPNDRRWRLADLSGRETATMAVMIAVVLWLGVYPQPVLDTARPALDQLQEQTILIKPPSPLRPEPVARLSAAVPPSHGVEP